MKGKEIEIIEETETTEKVNRRKYLSYFLISFPSFIIIVLGIVIDNPFVFLAVSLLVGFFQLVVIKNFLDLYYD